MKKTVLLLAALYMIFLTFASMNALAEVDGYNAFGWNLECEATVSRLPESLIVIGEEAFEGTALGSVQLPQSVEVIEDRAFASIPTLSYVYIPEATHLIGREAFADNSDLMIVGEPGSFAEQWAREYGYRFAYRELLMPNLMLALRKRIEDAKRTAALFMLPALLLLLASSSKRNPSSRRVGEGRTMRPQERVELHPVNYWFP